MELIFDCAVFVWKLDMCANGLHFTDSLRYLQKAPFIHNETEVVSKNA